MDVCTERMTKSFERTQFFFWTDDQAVQMDGCLYRMDDQAVQTDAIFFWTDHQAVWTDGCFYGTDEQAVRTDANFFERITQAVQTGANLFWTANKWLVNGIPFENGKPLVYVFAWEVTSVYLSTQCRSFQQAPTPKEKCHPIGWGNLATSSLWIGVIKTQTKLKVFKLHTLTKFGMLF